MDRLTVLRRHLEGGGDGPSGSVPSVAPNPISARPLAPGGAGGRGLPPVDAAAVEAVLDGPRAGMKAAVYEVFRAHPELLVPCTEDLTKGEEDEGGGREGCGRGATDEVAREWGTPSGPAIGGPLPTLPLPTRLAW
jgi:hypothetical protein